MQQHNNEASTLTSSNEDMRELTMDEVQMVSGGDAAATRNCAQNSWGERTGNPFCLLN